MNIISRAGWGARPPKSTPTMVPPVRRQYYVVHYSGAPATQTVRAIQDWCMNEPPHGRGFNDIDYNFLVRGTTGEIYEGRGWDVVGSHTVGYNTNGIGVCVISDGPISDKAKQGVRWLYEQANDRCRKTLTIKGHRELATTGTDCPGATIFAWVRAGLPIEEDDMPSPQEIAEAVAVRLRVGDKGIADKLGADLAGDPSGVAVGLRKQVNNVVAPEFAALREAIAGMPGALIALLADPTTPDEQIAGALVSLLGDRKDAVVALMR